MKSAAGFESHGHKVSVASLTSCQGRSSLAIPVDMAIKDVKTYEYDAMVFLGGEGIRILFNDESTRKLAKDAKYKVMAASDKAIVLLSLAGALEDKKVTGLPESVSWLLEGRHNTPVNLSGLMINSSLFRTPECRNRRLMPYLQHWRNRGTLPGGRKVVM